MEITSYNIAFLFSEIFTIYSIKSFYDIFYKIKKGWHWFAFGTYFLYFAVTVLLHFFVSVPFVNMGANILLLFCISLCYESSMQRKILAVFECYVIMFAAEILISALTKSAYIEPLQKYEYENIPGLYLSRMMIFFVVLVIRRIMDMKKNKDLPYMLCLASLTVPIITISIELIFTSISGATTQLVVISMILLFAVNMMVVFLFNSLAKYYENSLKSVILEQEREYYHNQCKLMQKATEDVRSFKHDISNHFTVIKNLLKDEKEEQAFSYILELTDNNMTNSVVYSDTGNAVVDSIINYKLCNAELNNITVSTDLIIPTELPVEIMDISAILTNLLDNALQALQKIEENKKLDIKMSYKKGVLKISIYNTYNGIVKYENGEMITTKEDKTEHGYGIRNIETIAEKYNGIYHIKHDKKIFQSEVLIYTG